MTGALPYGSFSSSTGSSADRDRARRVGVRTDDGVLDLTGAAPRVLPEHAPLFEDGTLDRLLAAGPPVWEEVRAAVAAAVDAGDADLLPEEDLRLGLPFRVTDYADFFASEHHATRVGQLARPESDDPLPPSWRHQPLGYHSRTSTVLVSGDPVVRPSGQRRRSTGEVVLSPSARLDFEAELGFVVCRPSQRGRPVPLSAFADHVFGVVLLNDWSARDLQAWESVPLGPFPAKSVATSLSPWVVPLAALGHARVPSPPRDVALLPYLDDEKAQPWGLDVRFEIRLNGHVVSAPSFGGMYWTGAQMLAHMTVNGASLRTGDLFASGTVSGGSPGCLIELTWNGQQPLTLPDGTDRTFLADGDEVVITATAPGPNGTVVGLGEVRGRIRSAPPG